SFTIMRSPRGACRRFEEGNGCARGGRRNSANSGGFSTRAARKGRQGGNYSPGRPKKPPLSRRSLGGGAGRLFEPEFLDAVANLVAIQPEERGRPRLVPATALERLHHERPFELFQIDAAGGQRHAIVESGRAGAQREV